MLGRAYSSIGINATACRLLHVCIHEQIEPKINLQYYNM